MRILIAGGRDFNDIEYIVSKTQKVHSICPITKVIVGCARGVDSIAATWAELMAINCTVYKADWDRLGKKAGIVRNLQMLEYGKPDLVLCFPGGRGTEHMATSAREGRFDLIQYRKISFRKEDIDYGFMSNFFPYPIIDENGLYWPSTEHYYQAHKTLDERLWIKFQKEEDPAKVKQMGKEVLVRHDWAVVREDVMRKALRLKFIPGTRLAELLLETEEHYLWERAPWDSYWGGGKDGQGQNRLGWLLMELRDEIRQTENRTAGSTARVPELAW